MNVTDFDQCLSNKWVEVNASEEDDKIQLGVLLSMQGKVRVFRGNRQITCQQISKLEIKKNRNRRSESEILITNACLAHVLGDQQGPFPTWKLGFINV